MIVLKCDIGLRETFLKRKQLHFLAPLIRPIKPNIFIFHETRIQYKVTGKNTKKSDTFKGV
jgi:hypothetical protein